MAKAKSYIGIKNEAASSTLELHFTDYVYDGFDWETWEETNLVQETIDKIKAADPSKIKIVINSLGGDVMIGLALYNYLKNHKAEIEVDIIGFAASIASVLAMSASAGKLKMAKAGFMIIHAAWSFAVGNAQEMREQADNLDKVTNELAGIYALRSGKEAKDFTKMWADGDVWLTGTEAMELGLCDEIYNAEPVEAKVDLSEFNFKHIPAALMKASAGEKENPKTFFANLKSEFMKLIESFKASISGAKTDKKYENVPNREEILNMVQDVLSPVLAAMDDAEEEKPEEPKVDTAAAKKPEETKVEEAKVEETAEVSAAATELEKLRAENKKLKENVAGKITQPENEKVSASSELLRKVHIEYEN